MEISYKPKIISHFLDLAIVFGGTFLVGFTLVLCIQGNMNLEYVIGGFGFLTPFVPELLLKGFVYCGIGSLGIYLTNRAVITEQGITARNTLTKKVALNWDQIVEIKPIQNPLLRTCRIKTTSGSWSCWAPVMILENEHVKLKMGISNALQGHHRDIVYSAALWGGFATLPQSSTP